MAKGKVGSSYFSVIVSMSLVLFVLSVVMLFLLQSQKLSKHVKENIGITVFLNNDVKELEINKLKKSLDASVYVKEAVYVDAETAAANLEEEIGQEFLDFLGFNPLLNSIEVKLNAQYAHPDSVRVFEEKLMQNPKVREVDYQPQLLSAVTENTKKISLVLIGFAVLLWVVSFTLINNTIQLAIYSKRFIIRSMQLVGATENFIRKPFVQRGIINGFIGAFIALGLTALLMFYFVREFPDVFTLEDLDLFAELILFIVGVGVLGSMLSTRYAVTRYLRKQTDQLYK